MSGSSFRKWIIGIAVVYALLVVLGLVLSGLTAIVQSAIVHNWYIVILIFAALLVAATATGPGPREIAQEYPPSDEGETIQRINALLIGRLEIQYDEGKVLRDTHPKSNGLAKGRFVIEPNLSNDLRVGLFREPTTYDCWCRFSNSVGLVTPDRERDFRGLAVKLFEVPGEKLLKEEDEKTFDFLFIGHDAFFAGTAKDFLQFFARTTHFGRRLGRLAYGITHPRGARNSLVGERQYADPSEIRWFSVAPFLFGKGRAVKYAIYPRTPMSPLPENPPGSDYLRVALTRTLKESDVELDFMIQFQVDPYKQPIEDTTVPWRAKDSPWQKVATIQLPKQDINHPDRFPFDENLTYNPWHCLPEHRPLGGVNRARRDVMRAIQEFRLSQNDQQRSDPVKQCPA